MKKEPFAVLSVNISREKGVQKTPTQGADLIKDHGILDDAHAGPWHRQVSLLADEDIDTMRGKGVDLPFGVFAENITTRSVPLGDLPLGAKLEIGDAILEITQHGKECHQGCAIFQAVGDCVMPRKGVFAKVVKGGQINSQSTCYYYTD